MLREFNRKPLENAEDLDRLVREMDEGDSAALLVQRGQNTFYAAIEIAA